MGARTMAVPAAWQPWGAALWGRIKRVLGLDRAGANASATARSLPAAAPATRAARKTVAPNEAFTPTRPRAGRRALVGRHAELTIALQALTDEAAHVVLYSERGRGKTSLANLVVERLRRGGVIVGRHACDAASDFDQIIRGLLRDLPASLLPGDDTGAADGDGCLGVLPQGKLLPADIAAIPGRLSCNKIVFVVDEFDRVQDEVTRTRLADTIKMLSDRGDRLLFMIVGVSTTLEHILGQHPSIERNITSLHLPLLTDDEIAEMLTRGGHAIGVTFTDAACVRVAGVARGMPYMAQLMGLRITQMALLRGASETSAADVAAAVERMVTDVSPETVGKYAMLMAGADGEAVQAALQDIAQAPQDKWGRMTLPAGLAAAPHGLEKLLDSDVLLPAAGAPGRFQYADRKLIYYVLLLAARGGGAAAATRHKSQWPAPAPRSASTAAH